MTHLDLEWNFNDADFPISDTNENIKSSVDRGIHDFETAELFFSNYLPNLDFLIIEQNYSIDKELNYFYLFIECMFVRSKLLIFSDNQTEMFKNIDYDVMSNLVPKDCIMVFLTKNVEELKIHENLIVYNCDVDVNSIIDIKKLKNRDTESLSYILYDSEILSVENLKNIIIGNIKNID